MGHLPLGTRRKSVHTYALIINVKEVTVNKRMLFFALLAALLPLAACAPASTVTTRGEAGLEDVEVVVYASPTCGCCGDWIAYMEDNGHTVQVEETQDLGAIKQQYGIPPELLSCHTAIVDGYVIEGHVPVDAISRLLDEKPDITGLAVPGMPLGSPGMEATGAAPQPFDVIAFDVAGNSEVFASYKR